MEIAIKEQVGSKNPGDTELCRGISEINKADYKNALRYFEKGPYNNEYASVFAVSIHFVGFQNTSRDLPRAYGLYKKAATKFNNRVAQYVIGMMYLEGDYVSPSINTAIHWLEKSANQGWNMAQARLGFIYQCSYQSDPENVKKATNWYENVIACDVEMDQDNDKVLLRNLFGLEKFKINFKKVKKETLFTATKSCKGGLVNVNKIILIQILKFQEEGAVEFGYLMFWLVMSIPFYSVPNIILA